MFLFLLAAESPVPEPLDFGMLNPPDMLKAMIASFTGDEQPLANLILRLMHVR